MTGAGAGLLQAVVAGPDDDGLRLVYADWLDDHGTHPATAGLAELIRVQIRLQASRNADTGNRALSRTTAYRTLLARQRELTAEWGAFWGQEWCGLAGLHALRGEIWYSRGFPEGIKTTCDDWLLLGPTAVQWMPLREVFLSDKSPRLRQALGWHWGVAGGTGPVAAWRLPHQILAHPDHDYFPRKKDAVAALSHWCLRYARNARR